MVGVLKVLIASSIVACAIGNAIGQQQKPVTVGVLTDMAGPYASLTGKGSVAAARLAIADFGGTLLGSPIRLVEGDHQNKADIASTTLRRWIDVEKVDAVFDVVNSAVTLLAQETIRQRGGLLFSTAALSTQLSGESCSPYGFTWGSNSYVNAAAIGRLANGTTSKKWYFLQVDNAFSQTMAADLKKNIEQRGGELVGTAKHPLNTQDFSSFLLQAQSSGAQVLAVINGGADFITAFKQADEYGLQERMKLTSPNFSEMDIKSLGLTAGRNLVGVTAYYWNRDAQAKAVAEKFRARFGEYPTVWQISVYSAVTHYLKAVKAANSLNRDEVAAQVKKIPVTDPFVKSGSVRADNQLSHDVLIVKVKEASANKLSDMDVFDVLEVIKGEEAFEPIARTRCAFAK